MVITAVLCLFIKSFLMCLAAEKKRKSPRMGKLNLNFPSQMEDAAIRRIPSVPTQ